MRTLLLASLALLPACLVGVGDITGGDDNNTPGVCGDGTINAGETCDDSNTASGDGCSATCQTESSTPRVDGVFDRTTVASELHKTETVKLTLTSQGGFAGTVNIAVTLIDQATQASIPKVTIDAATTADLAAGASVDVPITITIPADTTGVALTAALKADISNAAFATASVSSGVTIDKIFTVDYVDGTGTATANHALKGQTFTVLRGTILRFHNSDTTIANHAIHGDGPFPHEDPRDDPTTQALNATYDVPTIAISPGSAGQLGCHTHGSASYIGFTVQ